MAYEILFALSWVIAAGLLGLVISALFAGKLKLPRRKFLVPYVIITSLFYSDFL